MSPDERLWWNVLLDAEVFSEIAAVQGDGPLAIRYFRVACQARLILRDQFGINLDELGVQAREKLFSLEEEIAVKEREENLSVKELLQKADEKLDELLKKK